MSSGKETASTVAPEAEDDDADGSTLFIKNLAWKTGALLLLMSPRLNELSSNLKLSLLYTQAARDKLRQ